VPFLVTGAAPANGVSNYLLFGFFRLFSLTGRILSTKSPHSSSYTLRYSSGTYSFLMLSTNAFSSNFGGFLARHVTLFTLSLPKQYSPRDSIDAGKNDLARRIRIKSLEADPLYRIRNHQLVGAASPDDRIVLFANQHIILQCEILVFRVQINIAKATVVEGTFRNHLYRSRNVYIPPD
jgi:hypothetical protein